MGHGRGEDRARVVVEGRRHVVVLIDVVDLEKPKALCPRSSALSSETSFFISRLTWYEFNPSLLHIRMEEIAQVLRRIQFAWPEGDDLLRDCASQHLSTQSAFGRTE